MEEIKEIYSKLALKGDFNEVAAKKFHKSIATIKNHWINGGMMPLEYQKDFLRLLKRAYKIQQDYIKKLRSLK